MPFKDKNKEREYQKEYHLKNWPLRKTKHKILKRKRRNSLSSWLKTQKQKLKCQNCKENHPACLDFHHINSKEKDATVSNMIIQGYSIETITKEIAKCIVLCKNCHAKTHYKNPVVLPIAI